ncbi:hypothetical protein GCM10009753_08800 [Streptantibioticus ferralitis]
MFPLLGVFPLMVRTAGVRADGRAGPGQLGEAAAGQRAQFVGGDGTFLLGSVAEP